jgi:hypothetical protein
VSVTEFTIKRSEWLRGEGPTASYLQRESDGKRCCLGFYAIACGYSEADIINIPTPWRLQSETEQQSIPSRANHTLAFHALMEKNDDTCTDDAEKERFIIEEFSRIGITVTFVD